MPLINTLNIHDVWCLTVSTFLHCGTFDQCTTVTCLHKKGFIYGRKHWIFAGVLGFLLLSFLDTDVIPFLLSVANKVISQWEMLYIKNNAWVTMNNDFFVTSDKKSLFTVTNVLFYFLHVILCHEHTNPLRTIIERSFRHCCQGRPFLTEHCDVTSIDLWRHANAKYWFCDVIFVYCHCTCKLAQRWSSLVKSIDLESELSPRQPRPFGTPYPSA